MRVAGRLAVGPVALVVAATRHHLRSGALDRVHELLTSRDPDVVRSAAGGIDREAPVGADLSGLEDALRRLTRHRSAEVREEARRALSRRRRP